MKGASSAIGFEGTRRDAVVRWQKWIGAIGQFIPRYRKWVERKVPVGAYFAACSALVLEKRAHLASDISSDCRLRAPYRRRL
jgi:hypothetical protein